MLIETRFYDNGRVFAQLYPGEEPGFIAEKFCDRYFDKFDSVKSWVCENFELAAGDRAETIRELTTGEPVEITKFI
jgi:hypothetical protein